MFGLFLFELVGRRPAFADDSTMNQCLKSRVFQPFKDQVIEGKRPDIPTSWPSALKMLIKALWAPRPSIRMTMGQVNNHLRDFLSEAKDLPLPERVQSTPGDAISLYIQDTSSNYAQEDEDEGKSNAGGSIYCQGSSIYCELP